jgi:hypothetical protein
MCVLFCTMMCACFAHLGDTLRRRYGMIHHVASKNGDSDAVANRIQYPKPGWAYHTYATTGMVHEQLRKSIAVPVVPRNNCCWRCAAAV